ncbi:MAG: DUF6049 family protein [Ilumatobacteraceae bacterium]
MSLRFFYRLSGELDIAAELAPVPTTTVPPTTLPDPEAPDAAPDEEVEELPPELRLRVVNYEPLTINDDPRLYVGSGARTAALSAAIDGVFVPIDRDRVQFEDDGSVVLDIKVGTDSGDSVEELVDFDQPGLYPIVTSLIVGSGEEARVVASHGTIVQRLAGTGEFQPPRTPIDLALATAIDEIGPDVSDRELTRARTELDEAFALTTAVDSPATLSVPPVVLVDASDDDAGGVAEALAGDELVSVPAAPLDISSAAEADALDEFTRQLQLGEDLLTSAVPSTPVRRAVWIANEPLSAAGAQEVRRLGYRYVIMTPTMYRRTVGAELPATDLFVNIALPDGGELPLLVVDEFGARLTTEATDDALVEDSPVEWAVHTIAGLILDREASEDPRLDRSRVVATPDLTAPDPRLIEVLERLVPTTPSLRFSPAGALTGVTDVQTDGDVEVTVELPDRVGPDLTDRIAQLDTTAVAMVSAGSMLPADDPRPSAWSKRLSALVSTGYTPDEVDQEVDALLAEAQQIKTSVVPPDPFTFTLTGASSDIDLRFTNTSDEQLRVLVRLSSPKLSFPEGEQLVELAPNEQTEVRFPVRARANGTSGVRVTMLTPAGEELGTPVVLTSRVTALTGLGQLLTVGFILVLATWWVSHWRKRRRESLADEAATVAARHPSRGNQEPVG